ncbi:MAG TPA: HEAT repeat domain-containing protein [Myxococcaceae bacterium]|jgi:hypothetical protein
MERFDEVAALGTEPLRELLRSGEPRERVWAAWALSLRMGEAARPELLRVARGEPDAGARRHFTVMLAGYRDVDTLAALAQHDPDGYVRASACHYLAAVSPPDDPAVRQLLLERLAADPFGEVRLTVTRLLKLTRQEDADTLARLVNDPEPEIREAALEAFSDDLDRFLELLKERVRVEPSPSLRRKWLEHWREWEGTGALLSFAASQSHERALEVFSLLQSEKQMQLFSWEELAPLTWEENSEFDQRVLSWLNPRGAPSAAREWLLSVALRETLPLPAGARLSYRSRQAAHTARRLLLESLEGVGGDELGSGERPMLKGLRDSLEAAQKSGELDEQEESYDEETDGWVYVPSLESRLLQRLRELLGSG